MICVTKIEVMNVSEVSHAEFMRCKMEDPNYNLLPTHDEFLEWESEVVLGAKFKNNRGEVVVIGACKEVEEALGLPFEVFTQQNKTIESLHNYHQMWSHMSPWKMIKLAIRRWFDLQRGMII